MVRFCLVAVLSVFVALFVFFVPALYKGQSLAQTGCDVDCLNDKITALTKRVAALEKKAPVPAKKSTAYKESFVAIASGSVSEAFDWKKVEGTDFWFDQSLYGNVSEVTLQGWINSGTGSVRLYDQTNSRVVDYSEVNISTANDQPASFYTKPLAIWRGQNQYYLQARSINSGSVSLSGVKLRIVAK